MLDVENKRCNGAAQVEGGTVCKASTAPGMTSLPRKITPAVQYGLNKTVLQMEANMASQCAPKCGDP